MLSCLQVMVSPSAGHPIATAQRGGNDENDLSRPSRRVYGAATGAGTTVHWHTGTRCRSLPPGAADPRIHRLLSCELCFDGCVGARTMRQVLDCWLREETAMKKAPRPRQAKK